MNKTDMDQFLILMENINELALKAETEMESILSADTPAVLSLLSDVRQYDDNLKYLKKRMGDIYKRMKEEIVPQKFTEQGISSITVDGFRFTVSAQSRTSIQKDMKDEAYLWLRNNGLGDIVTETVNSSTLSATAKTLMSDGIDLPDDIFNIYSFENTSITKV
tara:strand:- start:10402 stop:10890 length:489 start_codon:yes stop_codon:yes gene_type:complete